MATSPSATQSAAPTSREIFDKKMRSLATLTQYTVETKDLNDEISAIKASFDKFKGLDGYSEQNSNNSAKTYYSELLKLAFDDINSVYNNDDKFKTSIKECITKTLTDFVNPPQAAIPPPQPAIDYLMGLYEQQPLTNDNFTKPLSYGVPLLLLDPAAQAGQAAAAEAVQAGVAVPDGALAGSIQNPAKDGATLLFNIYRNLFGTLYKLFVIKESLSNRLSDGEKITRHIVIGKDSQTYEVFISNSGKQERTSGQQTSYKDSYIRDFPDGDDGRVGLVKALHGTLNKLLTILKEPLSTIQSIGNGVYITDDNINTTGNYSNINIIKNLLSYLRTKGIISGNSKIGDWNDERGKTWWGGNENQYTRMNIANLEYRLRKGVLEPYEKWKGNRPASYKKIKNYGKQNTDMDYIIDVTSISDPTAISANQNGDVTYTYNITVNGQPTPESLIIPAKRPPTITDLSSITGKNAEKKREEKQLNDSEAYNSFVGLRPLIILFFILKKYNTEPINLDTLLGKNIIIENLDGPEATRGITGNYSNTLPYDSSIFSGGKRLQHGRTHGTRKRSHLQKRRTAHQKKFRK